MALGSLKDAAKNFQNPEESTTAVSETTTQNETYEPDDAAIKLFELCNQARVDAGLNPCCWTKTSVKWRIRDAMSKSHH